MISNEKAREILDGAAEGYIYYGFVDKGNVIYSKYLFDRGLLLSDLRAQLEASVEWKNGETVLACRNFGGKTLKDLVTFYAETDAHYWLHGIGGRDHIETNGHIYNKSEYWLESAPTPEELAAKAREDAIEKMFDLAYISSDKARKDMIRTLNSLYDAGYRVEV